MSGTALVDAGLAPAHLGSRLRSPGRIVETTAGDVIVDIDDRAHCRSCAQRCLGGLMQGTPAVRSRQVGVADSGSFEIGERVDMLLHRSVLNRACGLVFGLPMLGTLAGAAAGWVLAFPAELGASVGAACAVLGVLSLRRILDEWIKLDLIVRPSGTLARSG